MPHGPLERCLSWGYSLSDDLAQGYGGAHVIWSPFRPSTELATELYCTGKESGNCSISSIEPKWAQAVAEERIATDETTRSRSGRVGAWESERGMPRGSLKDGRGMPLIECLARHRPPHSVGATKSATKSSLFPPFSHSRRGILARVGRCLACTGTTGSHRSCRNKLSPNPAAPPASQCSAFGRSTAPRAHAALYHTESAELQHLLGH